MHHRPCFLVLIFLSLLAAPAAAQIPDPNQSNACLVVCPAGDAVSIVEVRDQFAMPIPGLEVIIDFEFAFGPIDPCHPEIFPPIGLTDLNGIAQLNIPLAGLALGGVNILVDDGGGPIPLFLNVPLAGFDMDGSRRVDGQDAAVLQGFLGSTNNPEVDFDCNGIIDNQDVMAMDQHLTHSCEDPLLAGFDQPGYTAGFSVELDSVLVDLAFSDLTVAAVDTWGNLAMEIGPRPGGVGDSEIRFTQFSGRGDPVETPLGDSGEWMFMVDDPENSPGTVDANGDFSISFDWLWFSDAVDSLLAPPIGALPDSVDYWDAQADTVACTMTGNIAWQTDTYVLTATVQKDDLIPSAHMGIESMQATYNITHYSPGNNSRTGNCHDPCRELCIIPVIVSNTDGSMPGVTDAIYDQMFNRCIGTFGGACVKIETLPKLKIMWTAFNMWSNHKSLGALHRNVLRTNHYKNYIKAQEDARGSKPDCVMAVFMGNGNVPGGGGWADKPGDTLVINYNQALATCGAQMGDRLLAHEIGHTVGLEQNHGTPQTCMTSCAPKNDFGGSQPKNSTTPLGGLNTEAGKIFKKADGKLRKTNKFCCYREIVGQRGPNNWIKLK